tara:strand:+ start:407 stop:1402 length:996 start_codon:yes stop_codon:yes gene_type:complete
MAWRGSELFASKGWSYQLTRSERDALATVVDRTGGQVLETISEVTPASNVLTDLAGRLSNILEHETGVVLVRNFSLSQWDEQAAGRAFWYLATQFGTPVSQSAEGDRLFHVRDAGFSVTDPRYRGPMSSKRLSFHTDRCDVIGFLCLQPALQGGETFIVSSVALRDELRRSDPKTLEVLSQPYPYLRHTVDVGNTRPYCELPIFSEHEGYFAGHFLRVLIDRADVSDVAPTLTTSQRLALDALESLAEEPGFHVSFGMEAGDLLLLNNWTTFHRRNEFFDRETASQKRHLLRIWLAMADSRPIAPCFVDHFGATAAGVVRGGMRPIMGSND